jgi:hypothetical protein
VYHLRDEAVLGARGVKMGLTVLLCASDANADVQKAGDSKVFRACYGQIITAMITCPLVSS